MENGVRQTDRRERDLDPEVIKRRNELFKQYVTPYFNMIYKLVMQYSWDMKNVEENYNLVLLNFYRGIETYDPDRSIKTWLHICTKRQVRELERRRKRDEDIKAFNLDITDCGEEDFAASDKPSANLMNVDNYRDFYNDDILWVLDQMKPIHRDALILQEAGYSLKEIADIEYKRGTLKSHTIDTVKSRLFLARQFMKKHLTRDGKRKMGQENNDSLHRD